MRTPELDITLVLNEMKVAVTEDSGGDEPYVWLLGFKVDADTLRPPSPGSLIPTLGVRTFVGAPSIPWLAGPNSVNAPAVIPIMPALGTRQFPLRPALLDIGEWFDGLAGIVCLLWDQDAFSPSTSEAGHAAFNRVFGDTLARELTTLLNGDPGYDAALNRDAAGNSLPDPAGGFTLPWRLGRLEDDGAMKNAVIEVTVRLKTGVEGPIRDALTDAAGWDEILDPDDLLGADAVAFTGKSLANSTQALSLRFTDDGADYTATGFASGSRVRHHQLAATVLSMTRTFAQSVPVQTRVCWFAPRVYTATAFRQVTTTRFQVVSLGGEAPTRIRWFLDETPLDGGSGSVPVTLDGVSAITGSPAAALAASYFGGPGALSFTANGGVLDLTNTAGDGVFSGTVRAQISYPGDPDLMPTVPTSFDKLLDRGYVLSRDVSIITVDIDMDAQYIEDVRRCSKTVKDIDLKRIPVNFGKGKINPGDPPPDWLSLSDLVREEDAFVRLLGRQRVSPQIDVQRLEADSSAQRLRSLEVIRDEGLVSEAEYLASRARILAEI